MPEFRITSENLVVCHGGHKQAGFGHQRHYPVFKDAAGTEYVSLNGQTLQPISNLSFDITHREVVKRG
jgi:hypothetical protein